MWPSMDLPILSFIAFLIALGMICVLHGVNVRLGSVEERGLQRIPILRTFFDFHAHLKQRQRPWVFWLVFACWVLLFVFGIFGSLI